MSGKRKLVPANGMGTLANLYTKRAAAAHEVIDLEPAVPHDVAEAGPSHGVAVAGLSNAVAAAGSSVVADAGPSSAIAQAGHSNADVLAEPGTASATVEPSSNDAAAAYSQPSSGVVKQKRFRLDRDHPDLAYFEFDCFRKQGATQKVQMFHCVACDAGKPPNWVDFKSDAALKHIGKSFDSKGGLVERSDRYKGAVHKDKVKIYEDALRCAAKPSTNFQRLFYICRVFNF